MNSRQGGDAPDEESITLHHYGGGRLKLPTVAERDAFARGRIECAADLAEVCATTVKAENSALHTSLLMIVNLLHEANAALPTPQKSII